MTFNPADFPGVNTTFSNLEAAQLNAFRGAGEWFTWAFEVESYNAASHTFNFGRGGFQGAEGSSSGGRWYLEGIPELLDSPSEFYYDAANSLLYYWPNTTIGVPPPASDNLFYATTLEEVRLEVVDGENTASDGLHLAWQLFRVIGTQEEPVTNVVIRGLTLTGTARTELAPHGVPSGGDWVG